MPTSKKIELKKDVPSLLLVIAGAITAFIMHQLLKVGVTELWVNSILFLVSCLIVYYCSAQKKKYAGAGTNFILGILLFLGADFVRDLLHTYAAIPKWDFLGFYLFGKVGITGKGLYDPNTFMKHFTDLHLQPLVGDDYVPEIVNVGFWYPPPSMFLFLPLSFFSVKTAYIFWQTIISAILVLDILLLLRWFGPEVALVFGKKMSVLLCAVFILLFPGLLWSIRISQTVSVFLLFLLLLIRYIDNWQAGIYLVILTLIKPLAIVFALYFLFYRKWKIILSGFVSACIIILITSIFFGVDSFVSFITSPPTNRIPAAILYESTQQSIHGVLLRLDLRYNDGIDFQKIKIITYILSAIVISLTVYFSTFLKKKDNLLSFMIFIPAALLIYPNTLFSYTIMVVPVVLQFMKLNPFKNRIIDWTFLFALYFIGQNSFFLFNCFVWVIIALWSLPVFQNVFLQHSARSGVLTSTKLK